MHNSINKIKIGNTAYNLGDIFVAKKDVTTFTLITDAVNAGKIVVAKGAGNILYNLVKLTSSIAQFVSFDPDSGLRCALECDSANEWDTSLEYEGGFAEQVDLETLQNDLGSAAYKDVPTSGNASFTLVVMGNDTRLSAISTTWSALKTLRDNSGLIPGQWYRITDYQTTTIQSGTQSAGHQFDIIVRADSTNTLNENAYAAKHSGDTYFANSKLEAWELKYCLDNDTTHFAWADSTNGKGVIWWMKDEFDNECPYDFKNIQFKWTSAITQSGIIANVFYYTFSVATGTNDATVTDHSLNGAYCYGNKMGVYINNNKRTLNSNVFKNTSITSKCYSNTFGDGCYKNTFGNTCYTNIFGNTCYTNIFGNTFSSNILGNNCQNNAFGNNCYYNTFRNSCKTNTFGDSCQNNAFGNNCYSNKFGDSCYDNMFGNYCYDNTFGNYCDYNTFGNFCSYIKFGTSSATKNYCKETIVENGNTHIYLNCSATTSSSSYFKNVKIAQGVNDTTTYKTITHTTVGDTFQTVYKPINSVEVSV